MSKWIDAEWLMNFFVDIPNNFTLTIGNLRATVNEAPSIDIVRCKECKHRPIKEDVDGEDYGFNVIPNKDARCPCLVEDGWYSWMPKDNFFCGYGEREGE